MKVSTLDAIKYTVSEMMNNEHDEHAKLLLNIKKRTQNSKLLETLTLVYNTRIKLLENKRQKF